jgi:hypothetical protein
MKFKGLPRDVSGGLFVTSMVTAALVGILFAGWKIAGLPFVPFDCFDWLTRVLPGKVLGFGIGMMVDVIRALHLGFCVVPVTYVRTHCFHGANEGSNPSGVPDSEPTRNAQKQRSILFKFKANTLYQMQRNSAIARLKWRSLRPGGFISTSALGTQPQSFSRLLLCSSCQTVQLSIFETA